MCFLSYHYRCVAARTPSVKSCVVGAAKAGTRGQRGNFNLLCQKVGLVSQARLSGLANGFCPDGRRTFRQDTVPVGADAFRPRGYLYDSVHDSLGADLFRPRGTAMISGSVRRRGAARTAWAWSGSFSSSSSWAAFSRSLGVFF